MPDFVSHLLALALLVGGTVLFLRFFGDRMAPYPKRTRRTLALATAGGLIGAPFWWSAVPVSFAWAMPGLAFRFLAAAGLAFGAVGLAVMARPSPARIRFLLGMLATYLGPLLLLIVIFHRNALDWSQPIAWAFLAITTLLTFWSLLEMVKSKDLRPGTLPGPFERGVWTLGTVLFALWSAALLVWPWGGIRLIWPWPDNALTTRLIGAMLLTLFLMSWMARNRVELTRIAAIGFATYGLWVGIACALRYMAGQPVPWLYALVLGGAGLLAVLRLLKA